MTSRHQTHDSSHQSGRESLAPLPAWARSVLAAMVLGSLMTLSPGCRRQKQQPAPPPAPSVGVVPLQKKTVPLYRTFVGSTVAYNTIEVRARVEGFLLKRHFKEGSDVNAKTLLFEIDPRQYQAALDRATSRLGESQAQAKFDAEQETRFSNLFKKGSTSQEKYQEYVSKAAVSQASVKSAEAQVAEAKLKLEWCKVYAPIAGRIGQANYDEGNLVGQVGENSVLATLVQIDPIYVDFQVSAETLPQVQQIQKDKKVFVSIVLPDGSTHPYTGTINFVDNTINSTTGTVLMRATIPNPDKTLLPGLYAKARISLGSEKNQVMVPVKCLQEDQSGPFVFQISKEDKVVKTTVTLGESIGPYQVVTSKINTELPVIYQGLMRARPGTKVKAEKLSPPDWPLDEKTLEPKGSTKGKPAG